MEKLNGHSMDNEIMNSLVKYVTGNPFPRMHTVMDVDEAYGFRVFSPTQILESTRGDNRNIRFLIAFQNTDKCKFFASKEAPGFWKPLPHKKSIFDANKRHIGNIKISWYHYYNIDDGRDKSRSRTTKSEWQIREYYLAPQYLPPNKVERRDVLLTVMFRMKEQKANNNNEKYDEEMKIIQFEKQQIMQSLQGLQL